MTATEELRRLLDERGVEWDKGAFPDEARTYWKDTFARPWNEQHLYVAALLTPKQAVEATLGRGKCLVEYVSEWMGWHCKSCDVMWQGLSSQPPKFCPNCGREVEQ